MEDQGDDVARKGADHSTRGAAGTGERRPPWFVGAYDHSVDDKGRLVLPAAFREHFGSGSRVWVRNVDHVELMNADAWEAFANGVTENRAAGRLTVAQASNIFMNASEIRIDGAGRFLIPERLRDKARLGRDVQICGRGRTVVIRDRPADTVDDTDLLVETADRLDELGL